MLDQFDATDREAVYRWLAELLMRELEDQEAPARVASAVEPAEAA